MRCKQFRIQKKTESIQNGLNNSNDEPDNICSSATELGLHLYFRYLCIATAFQGCIRPRPSPFQRPSTRYNGVSTPLGGVDCRISG